MEEMEKHLKEIYNRAEKEIKEKTQKFFEDYKRKNEKMIEKLNAGKITQEELLRWRNNQLMTGLHWTEMSHIISEQLVNADKTAAAYVNGKLPGIYALNYNELGEKASKIKGFSFELVNESAVKNLATSDKSLLPYKKVNGERVERWCTQKLNAEVMQGIIQGESVQNIAKRLGNVVGMEKKSAIRNARTTTTSAENKGRLDSYKEAQKQGLVLKKRWISTHDLKTRDWHTELDNVEVDVDEPFENHLADGRVDHIMYPGDPDADPSNVYNCRCAMVTEIKGFVSPETGELIEVGEEAEIEQEEETKERLDFYSKKLEEALGDKYDGAKDLIENSDAAKVFAKYADECQSISLEKNGGYYSPSGDRVVASLNAGNGRSEYSTVMHEMNHMIDEHMIKTDLATFGEVEKLNEAMSNAGYYGTFLKKRPSQSDEFLTALRKDMGALESKVADRTIAKELFEIGPNKTSGVQDALDGFFGTQSKGILPWGHGDRYYNRAYNNKVAQWGHQKEFKEALKELGYDVSNQTKAKNFMRHYEAASEAWANVGSAVVCGGDELKAMETFMPNSLAAYLKIVKGVE